MTVAAVAVVAALLALLLRRYHPEQAMMLGLVAGAVMLLWMLSRADGIFRSVRDLFNASGLSGEYSEVVFKGLGICVITQLASDTCRDAGESAMASKAELAGRLSLLMVALPLFQKVISIATSLIGG